MKSCLVQRSEPIEPVSETALLRLQRRAFVGGCG